MADENAKKPDWAIAFLGRLCLIGWVCAILYESFDFFTPLRNACLLFGPWACVLALLNGISLLLMRRQGIFLFFVLLVIPPSIHFGFVLKNVAIEKKWFGMQKVEASNPATETKDAGPKEVTPPETSTIEPIRDVESSGRD